MRDVEWRRSQFPALNRGVIHLDGPGGSQTPTAVIEAVSNALKTSMSNTGWGFPASEWSERTVHEARAAVADLLGAAPDAVAFGGSMTALTYRLAAALGDQWQAGDEVVVTELDHDANVRPWVQAAERAGATVRWAKIDPISCELATQEIARLLTPRTRVVAITASSNAVGTRPDIPAIAKLAHDAGALVYLDAVHAVPHGPVTLAATGADIIACSAYKFFGPHIGCIASTPQVLADIHPPRLAPATDRVPDRFELGTLPFEQLAGVTAAIDFLASLSEAPDLSRAARLHEVMRQVEIYCDGLFGALVRGLKEIPGVTVLGPDGPRAPTLSFTVSGQRPRAVALRLASQALNVPSGNFYAFELMRRLGLYDQGGALRVGLLHYNTVADVDALLTAVDTVAHSAGP